MYAFEHRDVSVCHFPTMRCDTVTVYYHELEHTWKFSTLIFSTHGWLFLCAEPSVPVTFWCRSWFQDRNWDHFRDSIQCDILVSKWSRDHYRGSVSSLTQCMHTSRQPKIREEVPAGSLVQPMKGAKNHTGRRFGHPQTYLYQPKSIII